MFLYHYTNQEDYKKILHEKILRKSPSGPNGRYGAGVYLTSLTPDKGRNKIKKNNLDGRSHFRQYADKTEECYLKFNKEDLDAVQYVPTNGGRDVWLNSNEINLRDISYYSGYTDYSDEEKYHPCASVVSFAEVNDESDSDGDYSYYGYGMGGDSRSISSHSSQQQQQQSDEIGLGGIVAGTAAVLAVGAAAFGLFAAFRQSRQNNQQ